MPIGNTKIVDMDSHLECELLSWESWIDSAWKPMLPKKAIVDADGRKRRLIGNSEMTSGAQVGRAPEENLSPEARIKLLDRAGIDIAVLSPSPEVLDVVWFRDDPGLSAAYCRAENNYMAHFTGQHTDRLKFAGVLPMQNCDEAVKEIRRVAELGMLGVNLKGTPMSGHEWSDPVYDPVWRELEALNWPIIIHDTKRGSLGYDRFSDQAFFGHIVGRVLESMVCAMAFICSGVLERFPCLTVIVIEMGGSHMPWWLGRMDEHYEKLPHLVPWLTMKPSEYFKRQMFVGCEPYQDPYFEWAVDTLGDGNLVLATDMPHFDAGTPENSVRPILESSKLSEQSKTNVLGANIARLFDWK